jgi:peroxiredoxin
LPSTIERLHQAYKDRGLVVLAINIQETLPTVAAWVQKHNVTMPVLLDPPGDATRAYQVTATPTAFLIGRDGRLVAKAIGTKPWMDAPARTLMDLLLKR